MSRFCDLTFGALLVTLFACSDTGTNSARHYNEAYDITTFAVFDAGRNYVVLSLLNGTSTETYLDGDRIIGEPFTDVNGNGVYDRGIDIFIKSADPTINQDLNHNGEHDGPNDPYSPGIPYADINESGSYEDPNSMFEAGEPFADWNKNGVRDTYLSDSMLFVCRPRIESEAGSDTRQVFEIFDSCWVYETELGYRYRFPERSSSTWDHRTNRRAIARGAMFSSESGLSYLARVHFGDTLILPLFDSIAGPSGTDRIDAHWQGEKYAPFSFRRTIDLHDTLTVDGRLLRDLVCVKLDNLESVDSALARSFGSAWFSIWFKENLGPLAISSHVMLTGIHELYFIPQPDTLPLPATR